MTTLTQTDEAMRASELALRLEALADRACFGIVDLPAEDAEEVAGLLRWLSESRSRWISACSAQQISVFEEAS